MITPRFDHMVGMGWIGIFGGAYYDHNCCVISAT